MSYCLNQKQNYGKKINSLIVYLHFQAIFILMMLGWLFVPVYISAGVCMHVYVILPRGCILSGECIYMDLSHRIINIGCITEKHYVFVHIA